VRTSGSCADEPVEGHSGWFGGVLTGNVVIPTPTSGGRTVSQDQFTQQDPTEQHAAPGSGDQTVEYPGRTGDMDVQPDHGEHSYRGTRRLEGKKAVITGGDSGIGRAVAIA